MFRNILIELRRDDALRFWREHPDASLDLVIQGFLALAKDRRLGPPGSGLVIHDESGQDWPLDALLAILRHEDKALPRR